ncbi:MAG: bifunctional hydroxymethylpyrimidine kinase/phosphomethylpyrimidine kinase [Parasporobacterium sp.]|nr:bifunctional hydroxymethylpyrimidine kinase/phosphomethylpyrimidine kinase [Parasporobacterium sp.]
MPEELREKYEAVVGGANIDICGQSYSPLIDKDSNPGFVKTSLGGVGRNIAHNLALLGVHVCFLTALGDDANAVLLQKSCGQLGMDISRARVIPGGRTSTYVFLNGPDGDMALAVSDMEICSRITPEYLESNISVLNAAGVLVIDTNIPEESIRWLAQNCKVPIFADPVSVTKAAKLLPSLGKLHTLKPNLLEAQFLSGVEISCPDDMKRAAYQLLSTGLKRVFISMGADGVFCADQNGMGTVSPYKADVKNATGAGDAFMAGLVWSYMKGCDSVLSARLASAASVVAIEGEETINASMSVKLLLEKAEDCIQETALIL